MADAAAGTVVAAMAIMAAGDALAEPGKDAEIAAGTEAGNAGIAKGGRSARP